MVRKGESVMKFAQILAALMLTVVVFVSPALAAKDTVKIGALLAVTGPASFLGAPEARSLEMLVAGINKKGGLKGKQIELIIKDTGASTEKAVSFAKQLIEEEKVLAIIGPSTSGETMGIKKLAEEGKTILLSCAAAEAIVNPVGKYVFKTPQKDSDAAIMILDQIKKMKLTKVGILSSNSGFGNAGKGQLEKLVAGHGLTIVSNEVYDKAANDLTGEVTKVKASGAEAIINWSIEPAQAIVIKNARQIGFTGPIFQSHGFGNIKYVEAAGAAAEGVMFPAGRLLIAEALPKDHPQKAVLASYKKDYETKFKPDAASTFGGHAYDAMLILQKGIEKANSLDKEAVRTAIEGLKGVVGTGGVFNFSAADHNGLTIAGFEMLTVKKGKFAMLEQQKADKKADPKKKK